jgi:glycosyltransferase involved in cell wall biosynthesis
MSPNRPKITLASPFSVFPPNNIKSRRLFHLYCHLANEFDIEIISLASAGEPPFTGVIAAGLTEKRIPKTPEHQQAEIEFCQELGANIADASLLKLYKLSPQYLQALKQSARSADFLITYQPYLFPALRSISTKPIWYEASGIETELKRQILPENQIGQEFWELIAETEQKCCQVSNLIITSSQHDRRELSKLHGIEETKIICVPNGIDTASIEFINYEQRLSNKEKLGLKDSFLAIFMGTGNPHNANEARAVLNFASKLPEMQFLVLGDVGVTFEPRLTPPNVAFIDSLDEKTKLNILGVADVALNPAKSGSDTLATVLEYFCRGTPVISTRWGVKNLGIEPEIHCSIGDIWRFPELLVSCHKENIADKKKRLEKVQLYIKNNFEWSQIASKFFSQFQPWSAIIH